jgi:Dyp-type peroxidase family
MTNLNQTSIDPRDLSFNELFCNLQGNILKGHGREHTNNIFLKFDITKKKEVTEWINNFAETSITSCRTQLKETDLFKRNKISGGTFYNLYLSAKGYEYFGKEVSKFTDNSFKVGMKRADLKDPDSNEWESGFQEEIHAMILIGDADPIKLAIEAKRILDELNDIEEPENKIADILCIEYGNALKNANGDGLEHFGYVDGISQPLFFKEEIDDNNDNNILPLKFDPKAKLSLVLVDDPLTSANDAFGSYFVFRKLEQNVRNFKIAEKALAESLGLVGEDKERAGAMLVGRFEDGTPVTSSNAPGLIGSGNLNNFDYKSDTPATKCPFHAHIRKSNPRGNHGGVDDKTHIMARRGITYGQRDVNTEIDPSPHQMPEGGVGLLFMSFQKSIENQFEFIQKMWVNDPTFPNSDTGIDPIIGQDGIRNISVGNFPVEHGSTIMSNFQKKEFESFVTMKGGEYFFAPSIPFLKTL